MFPALRFGLSVKTQIIICNPFGPYASYSNVSSFSVSLIEPLIFLLIDSRDKLFCKALLIADFNLGLASGLGPPTLTDARISRANFCHILACACCFLLV